MEKIVSYAQNGEDVVLSRALAQVVDGTYLDIGANDPELFSVTRSFYDRGWSGLCVEPSPALAEKFRRERPRDQVLSAVITDVPHEQVVLYLIPDTGLSTVVAEIAQQHAAHGYPVEPLEVPTFTLVQAVENAGLAGHEIHFAVIDTEGSEQSVLRSSNFDVVRPWILVVEATAPLSTRRVHQSWEGILLDAGYVFCLFDGLSRFYVDAVRHPELVDSVSYPAGVFDNYVTTNVAHLEDRLHDAEVAAQQFAARIDEMSRSRSWRFTAPLRAIRRRVAPCSHVIETKHATGPGDT